MIAKKTITRCFIAIMILCLMFTITSLALFFTSTSVVNNVFKTGEVRVDFNSGKKVFDENDFCLEPGESISKQFTVTNLGTDSIYYRIYIENIHGYLYDVIEFKIYDDKENLLMTVKPIDFLVNNAFISTTPLDIGKTQMFKIVATLPEDNGNVYQGGYLLFDFVVNAVQSKNNPNIIFD